MWICYAVESPALTTRSISKLTKYYLQLFILTKYYFYYLHTIYDFFYLSYLFHFAFEGKLMAEVKIYSIVKIVKKVYYVTIVAGTTNKVATTIK